MTIGERIRYLRKNCLKIKSSEDFGKRIGISGSNVSNIETGRVNATDRVISDICTEFSVNEDWLRNGGSDENIFIKLSPDEELAMYTQMLLDSTDDAVANAIKSFILIYYKLDKDSQQVLQKTLSAFIKNLNHDFTDTPTE